MAVLRQYIIGLFLLVAFNANAQRIGLALSGGGAKGCTHIGVIKALEENEIPIDYISGTSMGAIIGSLYAMGYTTEEMEELITSKQFLIWMKGDVDDKHKFYFKEEEETPEFIFFKMSIDDSLSVKPVIPNSFIVSDQLNQACMYLYAQGTTTCHGDFDSLFVPFRCVASDITSRTPHVHKSGDLGDAVRSSMSFPFVFKPVRVNGHLMLDGGIYNNFPTDVLQNEFGTDYIIGSFVGDDMKEPKENNPISLLENLIMLPINYNIEKEKGHLLKFNYTDVSLLDFEKAKQLVQIGYDSTMAHIDEIKANIHRTANQDSVNARRKTFNEKKPEMVFKNIVIRGVNEKQEKYIAKFFTNGKEEFTFQEFRRNYFKLLSDKKFNEIIPHASYNEATQSYDLILDVELAKHFKFGIGGNVSSTTSNQLYISVKHLGIQRLSYDLTIDGQAGVICNNAHTQVRLDFPSRYPFCLKFIGDINSFNYTNKQYAFYEVDIPTEAHNIEFYTKAKIGIPFLLKGEIDAGAGFSVIKNRYHGLYSKEENKYDRTNYKMGTALLQYNHNSLSHKLYPISGTKARISAQFVFGERETHVRIAPDTPYETKRSTVQTPINWIHSSIMIDHYITTGRHFSLGLYGDAVYSGHGLEDNYIETILNSPAFTPTKHSKMVFNPAFFANAYLAAGVKPIFRINDLFHIRWENFFYAPHKRIVPTAKFSADYEQAFKRIYFLSEITCVAQLKYIAIGLYGNWYSYPKKNLNFGLNIGYLIFHDKFIE